MMAKKGLNGEEDLDRMPEPMRYLAMQAMHEGRPIPPHLMNRPGQPISYGSGNMFMGGDVNNSGKVGKFSSFVPFLRQYLTTCSDTPLYLPFFEHW